MNDDPFSWRTESHEERQERLRQSRVIGGNTGPNLEALKKAAARQERLAALPEELFQDDPEVQRLRLELGIYMGALSNRAGCRGWLEAQRQRLVDAIAEQQAAMTLAVFADVVAQGEGFERTEAALATIERYRRLLEATAGALGWLRDAPDSSSRLGQATSAVRSALDARLMQLRNERIADEEPQGKRKPAIVPEGAARAGG